MHAASHVARVGGVGLHYVERGAGEPVVLVHGGGHDWRHWEPFLDAFAERHRVVAYSRRYAQPNHNDPVVPDYSARTDSRDLEGLIELLDHGPVHLVSHSIGSVAALFLAVRRPDLVRSLVLAEPPVLRWARSLPGGEALWCDCMERMWEPARREFRAGRPEEAMRAVTDYFAGAGVFERLRPASRARLMRNAHDWEAFTTSSDPFPELDRAAVRALRMPILLLSGERTVPLHHMVDDELARLLSGAERVRVAEASHDMWVDQPLVCRDATLAFLARVEEKRQR